MKHLISAAALLACAANTYGGESPMTATQAQGQVLFAANCTACHGERGHATTLLGKRLGPDNALLEKRNNLPPELIRLAVRHGIKSMPWFRRAELSDRDLDLISNYLTRATAASVKSE